MTQTHSHTRLPKQQTTNKLFQHKHSFSTSTAVKMTILSLNFKASAVKAVKMTILSLNFQHFKKSANKEVTSLKLEQHLQN